MGKHQYHFSRGDVGVGFCIFNNPPGEVDAAEAGPHWVASLQNVLCVGWAGVWRGMGDVCAWSHLSRTGEKIGRVPALPKARQFAAWKVAHHCQSVAIDGVVSVCGSWRSVPRQEQRRQESWCLSLSFSLCFQRDDLTKIKNTQHHQFKKPNKHTKLPWIVNHKWFTNARDHQGNWGGCLWVTFEV